MRALPARQLFVVALLAVTAAYLAIAMRLPWETTAGRIGPGLFPRVLGALLAGCLLAALVRDTRTDPDQGRHPHGKTTVAVMALTIGFVPALILLGAVGGMVVYLLATLSLLNRGRLVQNLLVSVGMALLVHLLFDVWLNAAMPRGVLQLPF